MNLRQRAKRLAFTIIRKRAVNSLLRAAIRPFTQMLPTSVVKRVPVVADVHVRLPDSRVLTLTADGGDSTASALYWYGLKYFEPETIPLYFQLLKHCRVVLDIGANIGLYSLIAAVGNEARSVHAFEPVPRAFEYLTRNVKANQLSNIKSVRNAVTNYDGEIAVYVPRSVTVPISSSTSKEFREETDAVVVPAVQIDTYVEANNIPRVDLMKIDTESTEDKVLEGAKRTLARDEPIIICEVLKGFTENSLEKIFEATSYEFFHLTHRGLVNRKKIEGDPVYKENNYLFITREKIPYVLEDAEIID